MARDTHDAVLDSARRCFTRHGYRRTSVDDIATDARVAKGTVYLYCDSKQDLFSRAVERELQVWTESLTGLLDPQRPADEILTEMARRDAAFVEEHPLVAELLQGLLDDDHPELRDRFAELRARGLRHVVAVLELGVHQGVFADDLDVTATAQVLQEMQLAGSLLRHRSGAPLRRVRRQQAAALRLVLEGLERR